ncbi:MAG: carboxymuconolactone decarboxylase family protein [Rhodospirillaceae bacterium]
MTDEERFKEGFAVRRAVLGDDHVERTRDGLTAFDQEFDDMLTEWAWGSVWTRPGLERKTRSLLNIALLAALDRQRELGLHVQGALRTGCTEGEIKEVLLHCTAYLGVPAGIAAFKTAKEALVAASDDGQPDQKTDGQPDQKADGQTTD